MIEVIAASAVAGALANAALLFGPAEYFSLMVLGLVCAVALAHGSFVKALAMVVLGLLLGLVGTDIYTGTPRFTFGVIELLFGLSGRSGVAHFAHLGGMLGGFLMIRYWRGQAPFSRRRF